MLNPQILERFCQLEKHSRERAIGTRILSPLGSRGEQRFDHSGQGCSEELIETADTTYIRSIVPFHLAGKLGEMKRFAEQSESRQLRQQIFENVEGGLSPQNLLRFASIRGWAI